MFLSGKILSFKHKANVLYLAVAKNIKRPWIFSGFAEKFIFFAFDNQVHNLCINLIFQAKISWIDQLTVIFFSPGYILWLSPKALDIQCFSRIVVHLKTTETLMHILSQNIQFNFLVFRKGWRSQMVNSIKGPIQTGGA